MKNEGLIRLVPRWFAALIAASMLIVGYGMTQLEPAEAPVETLTQDLYDTIWIDKYPQMPEDSWNAYMYTTDNIGLSIEAHSAYKVTLEVFEFKVSGKNNLRFHFPHDGRRGDTKFKIEKLKKPTRHFDTQLTLESDPQANGEKKIYYTGPEFRSATQLPETVRQALGTSEFIKRLPSCDWDS